MTYEANEAAHLSPVELYTFTNGPTVVRVTSGDETQEDGDANEYTPDVIARRNLEASNEDTTQSVEIDLPLGHDIAAWFKVRHQQHRVSVTIKRRHREDSGASAEAVLFVGVAETAEFHADHVTVTLVPLRRAVRRQLPSFIVSRRCNWQFGGTSCGVVLADWTQTGLGVSLGAGGVLTISGAATGFAVPVLTGGVVTWFGTDGETARSTISEHLTTTTIRLLNPPTSWTADTPIEVIRGCDRTAVTCDETFENIDNFGGFPNMPGRDPFAQGWP